MDSGGSLDAAQETGRSPAPVVLDFPVAEVTSSARVPRRIRKRLMEGKTASSCPSTAEEIEAKLREADLRRQQFHEWVSSKAKLKPKSPLWASQEEDLGQRLQAKLIAAEQKRLSLLAKAQMRLAKLDELRQAAKSGVEKRFEKERKELGTKVEFRVQQAEANRMRLLKAYMQRRAALQERKAKSLSQRIIRENKNKERVHSAISQKCAAAEIKRLGLLEAEKKRARARVVQARKVAKTVCHRREAERRSLKEQLENRLQKAKRQRAEYLKQRGSPHSSTQMKLIEHGDLLSRQLARCWRQFVRLRKTTVVLAQAYGTLGINEKSVNSMPFEQLAAIIESSTTLGTVKSLLDRLESRFLILLSSSSSGIKNIDHLLKRLATPNRPVSHGQGTKCKGPTRGSAVRESRSPNINNLPRYPVRIVLCAYMILARPNYVLSGEGEQEVSLKESAVYFVGQFELLIKTILDGAGSDFSSRESSCNMTCNVHGDHDEAPAKLPSKRTFRSQLSAFDTAWCSYLYQFVVWKVKDARSLEEDLVRAACYLELSMMQTCKLTPEGQSCDLSHDMQAIRQQVSEDKKLLRLRVQHLSGDAGIERLESALSDIRSSYFEAKVIGSPVTTPVAHIPARSTPTASTSNSSGQPLDSTPVVQTPLQNERSSNVVRSLFSKFSSEPPKPHTTGENVKETQSSSTMGRHPRMENELIVNEIVHQGLEMITADADITDTYDNRVKAKVKETMEKAFWEGIMDSMKEEKPDYSRILGLVKEVRDELCELAPKSWKEEILDSIDLDILSQLLQSGTRDMDYLGRLLHYVLFTLQKLSAPANEDEMRTTHQKMLDELSDISLTGDKPENSYAIATIKGLRFVLEQIQKLKTEVYRARIQLMEPIIKGSTGLDYLQKTFAYRYGEPSGARISLPLTLQWITSFKDCLEEEWSDYINSRSLVSTGYALPPNALRSGGGVALASRHVDNNMLPECNGETVDKLVRLGLLKLASAIEGLTTETVPETIKLNVWRLRSVQSQLQQLIVIATSVLVLRQILVSEKSITSASPIDAAVSNTVIALFELLERVPDVGVEEIVDTMFNSSSSYSSLVSELQLQSRKEMMARMLIKGLQNNDAIFTKVSKSIYTAARGIMLGGTGELGRKLADAALQPVGAAMLLDLVMKAAAVLIKMAVVTTQVHVPWYRCLL